MRRLRRGPHRTANPNPVVDQQLAREGATGSASLDDFVARLTPPRAAFYGFLAAILGNSVLGLGVTLVLANQEAEQIPPPPVTTTKPTAMRLSRK